MSDFALVLFPCHDVQTEPNILLRQRIASEARGQPKPSTISSALPTLSPIIHLSSSSPTSSNVTSTLLEP